MANEAEGNLTILNAHGTVPPSGRLLAAPRQRYRCPANQHSQRRGCASPEVRIMLLRDATSTLGDRAIFFTVLKRMTLNDRLEPSVSHTLGPKGRYHAVILSEGRAVPTFYESKG